MTSAQLACCGMFVHQPFLNNQSCFVTSLSLHSKAPGPLALPVSESITSCCKSVRLLYALGTDIAAIIQIQVVLRVPDFICSPI